MARFCMKPKTSFVYDGKFLGSVDNPTFEAIAIGAGVPYVSIELDFNVRLRNSY